MIRTVILKLVIACLQQQHSFASCGTQFPSRELHGTGEMGISRGVELRSGVNHCGFLRKSPLSHRRPLINLNGRSGGEDQRDTTRLS